MDRPNQPGGNETGSDRLFEESWRAAQAGLRKRAQRLARGNSHRAEEWLSSTAVKALLFLRQSPERVRDPQGFLFLVLEHVYLDSARHQIREDRLIDRGIDLHDGQLERFAAVGSPLERLEQLDVSTRWTRPWPRCRANSSSSSNCASSRNCPMPTSPASSA